MHSERNFSWRRATTHFFTPFLKKGTNANQIQQTMELTLVMELMCEHDVIVNKSVSRDGYEL